MYSFVALSFVSIAAPPNDALKQVQGTWIPQFAEVEGINLHDPNSMTYQAITYHVENDRVDVLFHGKKLVDFKIKIYVNPSPKEFDILHGDIVICRGILICDHDHIVICFCDDAAIRPASFNTAGQSKTWLKILKRK